MLGKFLGKVIDVAVFPVKVCEEVLGQAVGSDRQGLKKVSMPLPTDVTDKIKEILAKADED